MLDSTVVVHYDQTDFGRIYLGDVGRRRGLGGANNGVYTLGQDRYMSKGQDATFIKTGDVLMSIYKGTINTFMTDKTAFSITW